MVNKSNEDAKTRNIGGAVPEELYWQFKQKIAERKEGNAQALTNAIRLYIEIDDNSKGAGNNE